METRVSVSLEFSDPKNAVAFYAKLFQGEPTKTHSQPQEKVTKKMGCAPGQCCP